MYTPFSSSSSEGIMIGGQVNILVNGDELLVELSQPRGWRAVTFGVRICDEEYGLRRFERLLGGPSQMKYYPNHLLAPWLSFYGKNWERHLQVTSRQKLILHPNRD